MSKGRLRRLDRVRRLARTGALAVSLALLVACGSTRAPAPAPVLRPQPVAATQPAVGVSLVARVPQTRHSVGIYPRARAARPSQFLSNPNRYGFPRVFLIKRAAPGWLEVYLPMRPNGSTAWIRRGDVKVIEDPYSMWVDLRRHRLTVRRRGTVIDQGKIGVGTAVTPTPSGVYYLTELFRLTDPSGPYGPWGFGLSAYSNVLHQFAGADGQIGIHGTNDPAGIGTNVSHGCIRLANAEIARLARLLPLGTPVHIIRS